MEVKRGNDKISNLEENALSPSTKAEPHLNRLGKHTGRREKEHYGEREKNWRQTGQHNKRKSPCACVCCRKAGIRRD